MARADAEAAAAEHGAAVSRFRGLTRRALDPLVDPLSETPTPQSTPEQLRKNLTAGADEYTPGHHELLEVLPDGEVSTRLQTVAQVFLETSGTSLREEVSGQLLPSGGDARRPSLSRTVRSPAARLPPLRRLPPAHDVTDMHLCTRGGGTSQGYR